MAMDNPGSTPDSAKLAMALDLDGFKDPDAPRSAISRIASQAAADDYLLWPGTIVIDTREQLPYHFLGLWGDSHEGGKPLIVRTVTERLESGDYSIRGYENKVAVERKSLEDLFGTLGQGRQRFERELERLAVYDFAAVMIEASWETIYHQPPPERKLLPKTIFRSVIAWQQRYPRIHWWTVGSRRLGEVLTFRILQRYWLEQQPTKENRRRGIGPGVVNQ